MPKKERNGTLVESVQLLLAEMKLVELVVGRYVLEIWIIFRIPYTRIPPIINLSTHKILVNFYKKNIYIYISAIIFIFSATNKINMILFITNGANLRSSLSDPKYLEAIAKCAKRAILSFQPAHIVHEDSAFIVPLSRIAIIMFCGNWAMIEWCEETLPTFG